LMRAGLCPLGGLMSPPHVALLGSILALYGVGLA